MFRYSGFLFLLLAALLPVWVYAQADTIALWTFESQSGQVGPITGTYGPLSPEAGSGGLTVFHQNGSYLTNFANPGNGTPTSLNTHQWTTIGDYIQFRVDCTGKSDIQIDFEQGGNNATGPRDFKVSYSTDGTNFTDLPGGDFQQTPSATGTWVATTYLEGFHKSFSLSADLNNAATAYIRLSTTSLSSVTDGSLVQPGGSSRFDNILITGSNMPLPIVLGSISAVNLGNVNRVDWNTTEEAEGDRFVVERSADAGSFTAIGNIDAKGVAGSKYSFTDAQPLTGINYYRLLIENNDGSKYYSRIVSAATGRASNTGIDVYPNPATGVLNIGAKEAVNVSIYSMEGKRLVDAANATSIDVSRLAAGMYMAEVRNAATNALIKTAKFVKQ